MYNAAEFIFSMDQQTQPSQPSSSWIPKLIVLLAVLATGGAVAYFQNKKAPELALAPTPDADASATDEKAQADASAYKDGVYTTTGNYTSPGGPETIDVTLTVEDGVIVDASVVSNAENPGSKMFQGKFIEGYKEFVIGQELADLSLSVVSGSSLTPKGFNDALEDIRTQATI